MNGILQALPIFLLFLAFGYTGKLVKTAKFDLWWSTTLIAILYPFFYFLDDKYHSVWYLVPTGFLFSYWFGTFVRISNEKEDMRKEHYWSFAFVIFLMIFAAGVAGMISIRFWSFPESLPLRDPTILYNFALYEDFFLIGYYGILFYFSRTAWVKFLLLIFTLIGLLISLSRLLSL